MIIYIFGLIFVFMAVVGMEFSYQQGFADGQYSAGIIRRSL